MDDEADRRGDRITGRELSVQDMALNEPTFEELACEHLIAKLGNPPCEVSQELSSPRVSARPVTLCQIATSGE